MPAFAPEERPTGLGVSVGVTDAIEVEDVREVVEVGAVREATSVELLGMRLPCPSTVELEMLKIWLVAKLLFEFVSNSMKLN